MKKKDSHLHDDTERILATQGKIIIPSDLAVFDGHFPGNPIIPGVYSLDLAFRLVQKKLGRKIRLKQIIHCKFLRPLFPGNEAIYEIEWEPGSEKEQKVNVLFKDPTSEEPYVKLAFLLEFLNTIEEG